MINNIIQNKYMKSNLTDSERMTQKKSGYAASYADKYKMKGGGQMSSMKSSVIFTPNNQSKTQQSRNQHILEAQWMGSAFRTILPHESSQIRSQRDPQQTLSSIQPSSPHELTLRKHSNILIQQQLQDDLNTYNNYRMLQKQYTQQMQRIKQQRQRIQKQCKNQRKRIAQAEQLLLDRKRKLHEVETRYDALKIKGEKQRMQQRQAIRQYEHMIAQLNQQHNRIKKQRQQQLQQLSQELAYSQGENGKLAVQLMKLQEQLRMYQQNDTEEQEKTMQQLQSQELQLKKDIQEIQLQQTALLGQLQSLNSHKISQSTITAQHTEYLNTYLHSFLLNQLQRAEQLLRLKQLQQQQHQQISRRKSMIKEKHIQLTLKQKRINEKHKLIDQLTLDIREKSTVLLNLYQQEYS